MQEDDFLVLRDDDIARVGQENELLSLEVEVLRAKLSDVDSMLAEKNAIIAERNRMVSERNATILDLRSRLTEGEDKNLVDKELLRELEQARRDLQWTLNRLRKTPLVGPLIRRRGGFERLAEKYLRE